MDRATRIELVLWQRANFDCHLVPQILRQEARNPTTEPSIYLAFHKASRQIFIHLQNVVSQLILGLRVCNRAGIADL
jgi:hypothetical protein